MSNNKSVLFAVVLYKMQIYDSPTMQLLKNAQQYFTSFDVFVYDNSEFEQASAVSAFAMHEGLSIKYVHNTSNPGVSKAYNAAGSFAKEMEITHLVFLDQDTELTKAYFWELNQLLQLDLLPKLWVPQLVCGARLISPSLFLLGRFWMISSQQQVVKKIKWYSALNSGMVIDRQTFEDLEGYDEDFPLDLSDHAFLYKYKKAQSSFLIMSALVPHNLSVITDNNAEKVLLRYKMQKTASKKFAFKTGNVLHYFWCIVLGVRYCLRFKTLRFLTQ
jgi:GT2 family glycosyltransferase